MYIVAAAQLPEYVFFQQIFSPDILSELLPASTYVQVRPLTLQQCKKDGNLHGRAPICWGTQYKSIVAGHLGSLA